MYSTLITKSNQITLTKPAREHLGVKPGDRVFIDFAKNHLVIERRPNDEEFFKKLDSFKSKKTKQLINQYAGKTLNELRKLPEYQKPYEEEYA